MPIPKQLHQRTFNGRKYTLDRSFRKKSDANAYAKKVRKEIKWRYDRLARVVKGQEYWLVYVCLGKRVR